MSDEPTKSSDNSLSQHMRQVLRHIWNPIGFDAELPDDEYDSYVPDLLPLIRNSTVFEAEIAAHLSRIETEMMCLSPKPTRVVRAARALLGLREAFIRDNSETLVKQTVSADGLRFFWLFQRSDGLYRYEHAVLRHENDENGLYSWWTDAGEGRSGLFSSTEEAERDTRSSID